jgi:hypothetical protein
MTYIGWISIRYPYTPNHLSLCFAMDSMDSTFNLIYGLLLQAICKLNFSHNETSDASLDFGFGSFGANNFEKSLKISALLEF